MKIVGISIKHDGPLKLVTVTGQFTDAEHVEADDVARLVDMVREAAGRQVQPEEVVPQSDEAAPAATAGRRRRHTNPLGDGETGEKPDPTEAAPTGRRRRGVGSTTSEASAPKTEDAAEGETSAGSAGRRRRSAVSSKVTGETGASASSAQPATQSPSDGGRRRRRTVEDAADEKAEREANPAPAASAGRRRRGAQTESGTASNTPPTEDEDKITDVDLTRAASNAAAKISNVKVKELLESYDVTRVSEIFQAHRKRFLKELADLVKKES